MKPQTCWEIMTADNDGGVNLQSSGSCVHGTEEEAVSAVHVVREQLKGRGLELKKTWYIVRRVGDTS
jgi:lactam utilization protein B